jgi:hypothetical protein
MTQYPSIIRMNCYKMKKVSLLGFLFVVFICCENGSDENNHQYIAEVVGYDLNCTTCILSFPNDSLTIKNILGESPNNYYQTVNLNKNEFLIGQKIKVKVREAKSSELKACITLYPSYNYANIYVLEYEFYQDFIFNDTIDLGYGDCLNNFENQNIICFDSVINDSRCPIGEECKWEGNAVVRFKLERYNETPRLFDLNTNNEFQTDTLIGVYRLFLIGLIPYPENFNEIRQEVYQAEIMIKKE